MLAAIIRRLASDAGFGRAGITRAEPLGREQFLRDWLAAGRAGEMAYLARNADKRNDPRLLLDGARSVICLAATIEHGAQPPPAVGITGPEDRPAHGYVARYARGPDYHVVLRDRAKQVVDRFRAQTGIDFCARVCVDTAPLLERELAARAGLGWIGRNTMLIAPQLGSGLLLAEILVTLDLEPDGPMLDHCGRCRRCIDACPAGAIVEPHVLDASRCAAYLTIEHRTRIDESLRASIGCHLFGCDVCQSVCPFNRHLAAGPGAGFGLRAVAQWTEEDYRTATGGTAGDRATLSMWRRNAVIAMGNTGDRDDLALLRRLAIDPDQMVRDHANWALEQVTRKAQG